VAGNHHIQLITDGTAFLPAERLRELGVVSLPIIAQTGGQNYMYDQQTFEHHAMLRYIELSRDPVEII
jgi:fatty acid-binding protein DegV